MRININEAKVRPHTGFEFELKQRLDVAAYGYDQYCLPGETRVSGRMRMGEGGVFPVELCFDAEAEMVCSRCGRPFRFPVSGVMATLFAEDAQDDIEGERDIYALAAGWADLGLAVANEIGLLLPMQPLCREDCAGLCSCCGADFNQGGCCCAQEQIDPRWQKLREMLQDKDKDKD